MTKITLQNIDDLYEECVAPWHVNLKELPEIQGTEKQTKWAESIRLSQINEIQREIKILAVEQANCASSESDSISKKASSARKALRFLSECDRASLLIHSRELDYQSLAKL